MRRIINNHKRWRDRAKEARALAGQIRDVETERVLLEIARGYDRLAELAEERKEAR